MALKMARPIANPRTGIWMFKVRVPSELRQRAKGHRVALPIGDEFVTVTCGEFVEASLRTRDPKEAKNRHVKADAALKSFWESLRHGPRSLTHQEAVALSGVVYRETIAANESATGALFREAGALGDAIARASASPEKEKAIASQLVAAHGVGLAPLIMTRGEFLRLVESATGEADTGRWYSALETVFGATVDDVLARQGLVIDSSSRNLLLDCTRDAAVDALRQTARNIEGDYRPDPKADRFPPLSVVKRKGSRKAKATATITGLLEAYLKELQATGKGRAARKRWTPAFAAFSAFLKHDDATQVTKADVIAWKDHRLAEGLAPKTIRDTELAAFRAVFSWAVANLHLPTNPADGVKIKVAKKVRDREQGFTEEEAKAILAAADGYEKPKRESQSMADAKRWVPWLCAHSGARVTEVCQLRKEDVRREDGIAFVRITPDAGSVKTGEYRDVPLHQELVDKGFLAFVAASPDGPLFHRTKANPDAQSSPANTVGKRLAVWIRELGVVGKVAPNHGWRHRFKTVGREAGADGRVLDAICGHAGRTAGENYGDVTLKAKAKALAMMPKYGAKA